MRVSEVTTDAVDRLVESRRRYAVAVSPHYDEILSEVASRIEVTQSIGKTDIGALLFWKRLRADTPWVRQIMDYRDSDVRAITHLSVIAVNDFGHSTPEAAGIGRAALSDLPGFSRGDALASALMLAAAPTRMAVYDRRAQKGLEVLGLSLSASRGRYRRYMMLVESLAQNVQQARGEEWQNRDVDLALYQLGGETSNSR